jgi:hypothetical protein
MIGTVMPRHARRRPKKKALLGHGLGDHQPKVNNATLKGELAMFKPTTTRCILLMVACMVVLFWSVTPETSQANAKSIKGFGLTCGADCGPGGTSCAASNPCNAQIVGQECTMCYARAGQVCNVPAAWYDICWDGTETCVGKTGPCRTGVELGYHCAGTQGKIPGCGSGSTCWW